MFGSIVTLENSFNQLPMNYAGYVEGTGYNNGLMFGQSHRRSPQLGDHKATDCAGK